MKRPVELLVLSDIHLGTYGCHAKELIAYLKSIDPETIILNGDIIDIWQFNKHYWPKSHMKVVKYFLNQIALGKKIYYLAGNHDEMLRKFLHFEMGSFQIKNKLVLELNGKKAWFFHGDVFDVTMQYSKWLTKIGGWSYDFLILINSCVNFFLERLGKEKYSFSKKIKNKVKTAVKFINKFEATAIEIAAHNNYDYVVCGHIHQPNIETHTIHNKEITYLNSGDWIENLTALEFNDKEWSIYSYKDDIEVTVEKVQAAEKSTTELFDEMLAEFNEMKST